MDFFVSNRLKSTFVLLFGKGNPLKIRNCPRNCKSHFISSGREEIFCSQKPLSIRMRRRRKSESQETLPKVLYTNAFGGKVRRLALNTAISVGILCFLLTLPLVLINL